MKKFSVQECGHTRTGLHQGKGEISFYFLLVASAKGILQTNMELYMASPTQHAITADENSYL